MSALFLIFLVVQVIALLLFIWRPKWRLVPADITVRAWTKREPVVMNIHAEFWTRRRDNRKSQDHFRQFTKAWEARVKSAATKFSLAFEDPIEMMCPEVIVSFEARIALLPTYDYPLASVSVVSISVGITLGAILSTIGVIAAKIGRALWKRLPDIIETIPKIAQMVKTVRDTLNPPQIITITAPSPSSEPRPEVEKVLGVLEMGHELEKWKEKHPDAPDFLKRKVDSIQASILLDDDK